MQNETEHYELHNIKDCPNLDQNSTLDERIRSIVKREGYISCAVSKKAIPLDGGNYLANLYEIDVKGNTADGEKETPIFVKSMAPDSEIIELVSLSHVYKTELFFYNELIKIFNELQDEGKIPANERYNTVKCYEESYDSAIIMENVTKKGFKTWFRMDVVTLDLAEESIKQIAKFHGLSFVLEHLRPNYFADKIKTRKTCFVFGKMWEGFIEKFYKSGMECLNANLRSKIANKVPKIMKKMEDYMTDQSTMYCLCHGDYRPNNIMIKKVDGKLPEILPLDYQLLYYGCPILDFLYYVYMATDREFRKAHLDDLKNLYYKSLDDFLQYFSLSAEGVLPRKVFENLYHEKLDYGLITTFLYCPFQFVAEDEDIPDVTKEAIVDIEFKFDDRFKDRLRDTVEEFIELGYL